MIKRFILAAVLGVLAAGTAYANCRTDTYYVNGKYTSCTICIDSSGNRMVTCY